MNRFFLVLKQQGGVPSDGERSPAPPPQGVARCEHTAQAGEQERTRLGNDLEHKAARTQVGRLAVAEAHGVLNAEVGDVCKVDIGQTVDQRMTPSPNLDPGLVRESSCLTLPPTWYHPGC